MLSAELIRRNLDAIRFALFTCMEILPVGIVVSLIVALILKRKAPVPPQVQAYSNKCRPLQVHIHVTMDVMQLFVGAEVFIEPGQSEGEVDTWFRRLKECGMTVTRIRLFESYMRTKSGEWDFSLFDRAFRAAERYGISVYGNLFPLTDFTDVGGFKFPSDDRHLENIATYISKVVPHFKQFSSLIGWVPLNEPGSGVLPGTEFTSLRFSEWKERNLPGEYESGGYTRFDFSRQQFLLDHTSWFLKWLATEIRKGDPEAVIHVNNHAIFQHSAEYDFPQWSQFLTSLGGSAHVSWHFGYFRREQYAVGMSAKSELIRSGAGTIPWFMTELQGGNNTYSAFYPLCPTKEEIAEWLWIVIATGGKGAIFWCLNSRASGFEAGEWAMLDFYDEPSDRMLAAAEIAGVLRDRQELFGQAEVAESGINILYTRESLWIEKALQAPGTYYEGRAEGGVMKSALAWFEALGEMGLQAGFKEIREFDFEAPAVGRTIILSHQIGIPAVFRQKLERFVARGGKLIADGLTAFYDEHAHCVMRQEFPLKELFGAAIAEFKVVDELFELTIGADRVPAHLWRGALRLSSAIAVSESEEGVYACRNRFGAGETLWIPSLIGLGCRIRKAYSPLTRLMERELAESLQHVPVRFSSIQPGMLMKCLTSHGKLISVIINKSTSETDLSFRFAGPERSPYLIFRNGKDQLPDQTIRIGKNETMVLGWE